MYNNASGIIYVYGGFSPLWAGFSDRSNNVSEGRVYLFKIDEVNCIILLVYMRSLWSYDRLLPTSDALDHTF